MNEYGIKIQLCKPGEDVCILRILACKINEVLLPAVDELKESLFVGFGNGD
jgi:hypothetical protein